MSSIMGSSRKEEERNEKIIRGLLKLPPNRRCINCNSVGPQYVCTNFWTFICITCSGIHREFTHRVKSVSMAKFTAPEVEALQKGGNQRARDVYLKNWDLQTQRLPDSSNPERIRDFIKSVYVDKKYMAAKAPEKPPRDLQSQKSIEDDVRRASSYHSYSQSPPYDNQYEERRYGKQAGVLARKPGSDRGHYFEGRLSNLIYSPGRSEEQNFEERCSNEGFSSRASDYSLSSGGDPSRSGAQSPNSQREYGFSSPPAPNSKNSALEDARHSSVSGYSDVMTKKDVAGIPRPQRTTSAGSLGSFDISSASHMSTNSTCLADLMLEPEPLRPTDSSASVNATYWDPFGPSVQSVVTSSNSDVNIISTVDLFAEHQPAAVAGASKASNLATVDLFAGVTYQQLSSPIPQFSNLFEVIQQPSVRVEQVLASPSTLNEGWATFDLPHRVVSSSNTKHEDANNVIVSSSFIHPQYSPALPHLNDSLFPSVPGSVSQGAVPISSVQVVHGGSQPTISANDPKREYALTKTSDDGLKTVNVEGLSSVALPHAAVDGSFVPSLVSNQSNGESHCANPSFGSVNGLNPGTVENLASNTWQQTPANGSLPFLPGSQWKGDSHLINPSFASTDFQEFDFNKTVVSNRGYMYSSGPSLDFADIGNCSSSISLPEPSLAHEHKSRNPFDLPNDVESEATDWFFDLNSLQAALPDQSLPSSYGVDLGNSWFPPSSQTYIPSAPPGGLNYMPGQTSAQLQNHSTHGSVASLGGNPFA